MLQAANEPLDDRDAPMLADGSVPQPNLSLPAPATKGVAREHRLLIADQVTRHCPDGAHRSAQERAQRSRIGLLCEHLETLHAAGEVIHDDGDPPTEGPLLRESAGNPRYPEAEPRRNRRQVDVPDVVRSVGANRRSQEGGDPLRRRGPVAEHPADGRWGKVKPGPAEHLGDLDLAQVRAEQMACRRVGGGVGGEPSGRP